MQLPKKFTLSIASASGATLSNSVTAQRESTTRRSIRLPSTFR
jgi:hypothetical protein